MADSRYKLAPFAHTTQAFTATMGKMTHHHNHHGASEPVLLLLDVTLSESGDLVADHVWVPFTRDMAEAATQELLAGDQLAFNATVGTYRIHRDDADARARKQANEAHDTQVKAFENYKRRFAEWQAQRQDLLDNNALVDQYVADHTLTAEQAATIKAENQHAYQAQEPHFDGATPAATPRSVDYELTAINHFAVTKAKRPSHGWVRESYDIKRWQERQYTKYLAARSMAYQRGVYFDDF